MAELADAQTDWSAMMVHFHNLDNIQHRLWPYLRVDDTAIEDTPWNVEAESCLRALDESVGRLLELASKRDAAVLAVSDHGFGPCKALVNVNGLLHQAGLQRTMMYGTRFRYRAQRLGDRFHRWLTRHSPGGPGRRLPRSLEGQIGCDWKRTMAFAPFGQLCGNIYLHPETTGQASVAARVVDEVIGICRDAHDPETGESLFRDVFSTADRYGVEPAAHGLADVMALSADGYQAQAKWPVSRRNERLRPDSNLPATSLARRHSRGRRPRRSARRAPSRRSPRRRADGARPARPARPRVDGRTRDPRGVRAAAFRALMAARPVIEEDPEFASLLAAGFGADDD